MTVSNVFTGTIIAKTVSLYTFPDCSVVAGDHLYVADLAGPSGATQALVVVLVLATSCTVFAR